METGPICKPFCTGERWETSGRPTVVVEQSLEQEVEDAVCLSPDTSAVSSFYLLLLWFGGDCVFFALKTRIVIMVL